MVPRRRASHTEACNGIAGAVSEPIHKTLSNLHRCDAGTLPSHALEQHAKRAGWRVVEIYKDHGISGAKRRDKRPAFDRLRKDATRQQFDVIAAWSVGRLGRSLQDLLVFLGEAHALGVDLYLHQQAVDTTTPGGKALFQMLGVFA
jgi:DNA invertase Pin-like site-specific DNA recombinase